VHNHSSKPDDLKGKNPVYLVGNPNVGKSVLFTTLTGTYATVSNYPGTTVEVTTGTVMKKWFQGSDRLTLIDTPGINSMVPSSEDERVTRDILYNHEKRTGEKPRVILVIDAKNVRRGISLALQLAFCKIPFAVAVNMMDEASSMGISIDIKKLREILGVEVVSTIAIQKEGIGQLIRSIGEIRLSSIDLLEHISPLRKGELQEMLADFHPMVVVSLFYSDTTVEQLLDKKAIAVAEKRLATLGLSMRWFQMLWLEFANKVQSEVYRRDIPSEKGWLNSFGRFTLHPVFGFVALGFVLYAVFKFVGFLGAGLAVDFLEKFLFQQYIIPFATRVVEAVSPGEFFTELLVGPFGMISMGVTYAVALILPIVVTFFIAFSFLEDSGYLPRLGSLLNNAFKYMGLNGKAILPMILGLGCDTMATMTARVMETNRERVIVTLLLALGVPCSAQLGVIFAFGAYLPFYYLLLWIMIVVGAMVLVGYFSSKLLPGKSSLFLLELPPLRVPSLMNILRKTYMRSKWYIKEAVPIFLIGTFILFVLDKTGVIPFLNNSLRVITTNGLGLPEESASSFVMGFLRRDFGAAGFLRMYEQGLLNPRQVLVSLVVITLFIPCIANFLMIIKERGIKTGIFIFLFIIPFAFLSGTLLNHILILFGL